MPSRESVLNIRLLMNTTPEPMPFSIAKEYRGLPPEKAKKILARLKEFQVKLIRNRDNENFPSRVRYAAAVTADDYADRIEQLEYIGHTL